MKIANMIQELDLRWVKAKPILRGMQGQLNEGATTTGISRDVIETLQGLRDIAANIAIEVDSILGPYGGEHEELRRLREELRRDRETMDE